MKTTKKQFNSQSGQIIIMALMFMVILLSLSSGLIGYTLIQAKAGKKDYYQSQALSLAEAGIDRAISSLNSSGSYSGESNVSLGPGVFTTTVTGLDANDLLITSTGYVPNSTNPASIKVVKAQLNFNSTRVGFSFGAQVGAGGVAMSSGAKITGNIYSNGNVSGGSKNGITGDVTIGTGVATNPDQQSTTQGGDFFLGNDTNKVDQAQSFIPGVSDRLTRVSLYLKKIGNPADLNFQVVTDNAGRPSQSVVAVGSLLASSVTSTYNWVDASLTTVPSLVGGTKYWLMLIANPDTNNYFSWGFDLTDSYAPGTGKYSPQWNAPTPSWTASGGDYDFRAYMGGGLTGVVGSSFPITGNVRAHNLSGCTISGDAYFGGTNTCTVGGTPHSGTADSPAVPLAISDGQVAAWEAIASTGPTFTGNPYSIAGTQAIGPAVINGNLDVTGTLDMTGPVWVKGNVNFHSSSVFTVDASLGNAGAVLIADNASAPSTSGLISIVSGTIVNGNGNPNSFPMALSMSTSSTAAITLAGDASGIILYAPHGIISVSGGGAANQISGYGLNISGNAIITYTNGLANATFANGSQGAWAYTPGTYVISK